MNLRGDKPQCMLGPSTNSPLPPYNLGKEDHEGNPRKGGWA